MRSACSCHRVPDDHEVDIGLRKLFGLDAVFLRCTEQIVQNATSSLSISINSMMPRFAMLNRREFKGPSIRVRTINRDLAIVDIAREFGQILVFLIFGLKRADTNAVLLAQRDKRLTRMCEKTLDRSPW